MAECACCRNFESSGNERSSAPSYSSSSSYSGQENIPCDGFPMIEVDEAIKIILTQVEKLEPIIIPIDKCYGHIISEDIVAVDPFPAFPASIMDGYAVYGPLAPGQYQVQSRILAGDEALNFNPEMISYITTGSRVPDGANSVVKVEDTERHPNYVEIKVNVSAGENVRSVGSDISAGELIIPAGTKLGPAEIGLLATIGIVEVKCLPKPLIGIMSTGDELVEANQEPSGSKIRDSNRPALLAAFRQEGFPTLDLGIVKDTVEILKERMIEAVNKCDVVITSGGVSMGEADFIKTILQQIGTVHFGRLNMKPGKPTTFASINKLTNKKCYFFGLPGNPVSCLVCKALVVDPALKRLQGIPSKDCMHPQVLVTTTQSYRLDPSRPEYHRVSLHYDSITKSFIASSTGVQRSSRLLSMRSANALICLPKGSGVFPTGSVATALLIDTLPSPSPDQCYHSSAASLDHFVAAKIKSQQLKDEAVSSATTTATATATPKRAPQEIVVSILTISDRAYRGVYADESGPELIKQLKVMEQDPSWPMVVTVRHTSIVPDEREDIQRVITQWTEPSSNSPLHLILTSGGTGFSPRDITPESIRPLLHREAPAIAQSLINEGLKHTPLAVLSRPVVGTRYQTLICTLPGSVKAIRENLTALKPLLPRIINLMSSGQCSGSDSTHQH